MSNCTWGVVRGTPRYPGYRKNSPEMNVSDLIINPCESQLKAIKNKKVVALLRRKPKKGRI